MTRSGLSPRLGQHLPEPFVEVHPDDAIKFGVSDGDFARVVSDYGQCTLRVAVSERQQRGMLFARSTGARRPRQPRASARWWHRSPIRFPASREQGDAGVDRAIRICLSRLRPVADAARTA